MSEKQVSSGQRLSGKCALISGAARRVGREIALQLAREGADVVFTYNASAEDAESLSQSISAMGRRCLALQSDLAQPGEPEKIFQAVEAEFGALNILVNNASTFEPTPFGTAEMESFDRDMAVNARAPLMLSQLFAPMLRASYKSDEPDSMGRIVNFIDIHVLGEPLREYISYNASKAALMEITSTSALELAPAITVNAIAPGVVKWAPKDDPATQRDYMKRVPLARAGTPLDAATAVLFLVAEAHYCTGQIIRLDGGRYLT